MELMRAVRTAICAGACMAAATAAATAADPVKFTSQEWAPYQVYRDGVFTGPAVETVMCVMGKLGTEASIEVLPWARAQLAVKEGQADAFFAASKSKERDEYAVMSDTIAPQVWRWYFAKGKDVDVTAKDKTVVAAQLGSNMATWLETNEYKLVNNLSSSTDLVRVLKAGRVDAVLANELTFSEDLAAAGEQMDQFDSLEHSNRPLGVYFSKAFLERHPDFMERFNAGIPGCKPA